MKRTIIELKNISKKFIIPHERVNSLKSTVLNLWKNKNYETFYALKDICLTVNEGEFLGIVGRNGSGKSTLLKILAGIYEPDGGTVSVRDRISPFLELGVGFSGELSGRDNIYLYGSVLGLTKKQIDSWFDEIVSFAELEKFIDLKMKNYSSGMFVRLAFSVAIRSDAPILLVDEVLAVGDVNFRQKCFNVFESHKREGKTVLLVSHDPDWIKRFCDRTVLIKSGRVSFCGDTGRAVDLYLSGE
ncbi:MAG: ABC transporter ATP-binding protein [Candidatus Margulisiibacteriota bacterium]